MVNAIAWYCVFWVLFFVFVFLSEIERLFQSPIIKFSLLVLKRSEQGVEWLFRHIIQQKNTYRNLKAEENCVCVWGNAIKSSVFFLHWIWDKEECVCGNAIKKSSVFVPLGLRWVLHIQKEMSNTWVLRVDRSHI